MVRDDSNSKGERIRETMAKARDDGKGEHKHRKVEIQKMTAAQWAYKVVGQLVEGT